MNSERDRSAASKELQGRLNTIKEAMVIIGMAGGSALAMGTILESFLNMPHSELTIYAGAMISAAISGGGLGAFVNHLDRKDSRKS